MIYNNEYEPALSKGIVAFVSIFLPSCFTPHELRCSEESHPGALLRQKKKRKKTPQHLR